MKLCRRITLVAGVIVLPALLFATAPDVWSNRGSAASPDPVLTQRHQAVTAGAVVLAKTVLPESVGLMMVNSAAPAVPVAMVMQGAESATPEPPPPEPLGHQQGEATWYDYFEGTCAHVTLPMGTIVTVTRLSTGASTTCQVADRGPFGEGRVIDLEKDVFAQLGDPSEGIFQVSLEW